MKIKMKKAIIFALVGIIILPCMMILTSCEDDPIVKKINVSTYDELVTALKISEGDSVIVLQEDIDVVSPLIVSRKIVIDMNQKKLLNVQDIWDDNEDAWSLISVKENGELLIKGNGEFIAKENDCYCIDVVDGGNVVIENGNFRGNIHAIYVYEGSVIIKGGTYAVQQKFSNDKPDEYVLNCFDCAYSGDCNHDVDNNEQPDHTFVAGSASIIVKGGSFVRFNPANCQAEGLNTNFVAQGYTSTYDEKTFTYIVTKNS